MNKRQLLADLCERTGATTLALELRKRTPLPWLPVITFHRVVDINALYAFDEDVIGVTPSEFARQLAILRANFSRVTITDVIRAIDRGGGLPNNPVLVTFDDGYRDNHDIVLPLLRRYGVKATFFIATDYISRRRIF